MLDQQPVDPLAAVAVVAHTNKHEAAMQPIALQRELEIAFRQCVFRGPVAFRLPVAAIPEHHRTTAILALGNGAFEITIVERVILDLDGQPLVAGIEGWSSGHRPGFEYPIELEAKIVMQPSGVVLLDHEPPAVR
ncbi:hypothetical protein D3C71_1130080 [compost metagenome]